MSDGPESRYTIDVHAAAGMVSVQADCEIEMAYALMSDRAANSHVSLDELAAAVIDRSISFGSGH